MMCICEFKIKLVMGISMMSLEENFV